MATQYKPYTPREILLHSPGVALDKSFRYSEFLQGKYPVSLGTVRDIEVRDYQRYLASKVDTASQGTDLAINILHSKNNQSNYNKITKNQLAILFFKAQALSGVDTQFIRDFKGILFPILASEGTPHQLIEMNDFVLTKIQEKEQDIAGIISRQPQEKMKKFFKEFCDDLAESMEMGIMCLDFGGKQSDHLTFHGLTAIAIAFLSISNMAGYYGLAKKLQEASTMVIH